MPETTATSHQDLAEVLASRPLLASRSEWSLAVPMWQRMLECPLLSDHSDSHLAVTAILNELGASVKPLRPFDPDHLTMWQQQQWHQLSCSDDEVQADGR